VTAAVVQLFPGQAPRAEPQGLHLSPEEVFDASGGYKRPADQLKALHARGFVRAYIPAVGKKRVVLERAHHDAVVRGQFGPAPAPAANDAAARAPLPPNRAGYKARFGAGKPGA